METEEYFEMLKRDFESINIVATHARERGYDPKRYVEIVPAPDLASRVGGIIGIDGIAEMIKARVTGKGRQELAFEMVKEICTGSSFDKKTTTRRYCLGFA